MVHILWVMRRRLLLLLLLLLLRWLLLLLLIWRSLELPRLHGEETSSGGSTRRRGRCSRASR